MRIVKLPVLALVGLVACEGPDVEFRGTNIRELFPFDGQRTWEFISTDESLPYKLVAKMRSYEPEVIDGRNSYTVDYTKVCLANDPGCVDGEVVRTLTWVSDAIHGVFIYSWAEGSGPVTHFDPPIQLAEVVMKRDELIETTTGGATWQSNLDGFEQCPVRMNVDWADCARLTLSGGASGQGLAGTYWAIRGFNVVAIELDGEAGRWELSKHNCAPDEQCKGAW